MNGRPINWNKAKRAILRGSSDFLDDYDQSQQAAWLTLKTLDFAAQQFDALGDIEKEAAVRQFGIDSCSVNPTILRVLTAVEYECIRGQWRKISK